MLGVVDSVFYMVFDEELLFDENTVDLVVSEPNSGS